MEHFDAVVVGGGQAGLSAGYYLARAGARFVILEASPRIGDSWRTRWDSLRLFTPSKFSHLEGLPFPAKDFYYPAKDELADYLELYAAKFTLPLRLNTRVDSLSKEKGRYLIASGERRISADNVVVATGGYQVPAVPAFKRNLDPKIFQIHSFFYRNPSQIPQGKILVVGAGNSGAEIAIELAGDGRQVWLSGRDVGRIPATIVGRLFGGKPYWYFLSHVLSIDTKIGRNVREQALHHGTPWLRLKASDISRAGVIRCPRVSTTQHGKPVLEDGQLLDVEGIVWATGFRSDYSWIRLPVFNERGYPVHDRGQVPDAPGLYFLGLHFQTALTFALIGGVHADARRIVGMINSSRGKVPAR